MAMTPYYEDDFATIYHGDCLDVLPGLSADVVVTDPPYGVGVDYDAGPPDTPELVDWVVEEALPLMRSAAPLVVLTPGNVNLHRYPPPTWTLAWCPSDLSRGSCPWGYSEWQPVLAYGADPFLRAGMGRRGDVLRSVAGTRRAWTEKNRWGLRDHPCPKSLTFVKDLVARVAPLDSDVVLDPFMGSGTTVHAAKSLGRHSIGIELSEAYCEIAAQRLAQEVLDFGGVA